MLYGIGRESGGVAVLKILYRADQAARFLLVL